MERLEKLEPYQLRVVSERDELETKLVKLRQFLASDAFRGIDLKEQFLLAKQSLAMETYLEVLRLRVERFLSMV